MIAVIIDWFSMLKQKDLKLSYDGPNEIELGTKETIKWILSSNQIDQKVSKSCNLKLPTSPHYTFPKKILNFNPLKDESFLFFKSEVFGSKLARNLYTEFEVRTQSLFKLWARSIYFESKELLPPVIPSLTKAPDQLFEEEIRNNSSLFVGSRSRSQTHRPEQFFAHRRYRHGDSIRHIDHKKSARYQKLLTKTYDSLQNKQIMIGLDTGRAMAGEIGGSNKLSFYTEAILNLAKNAIQTRDEVSLFTFSSKVQSFVPPTRDLSKLTNMIQHNPNIRVHEEDTQFECMPLAIRQLAKGRSLFILFSDFSRPSVQSFVREQLKIISKKHLCVCVSLIDAKIAINEQILKTNQEQKIDPGKHAQMIYGYWLENELQNFRHNIATTKAGVITIPEKYWMDMVVRIYMSLRSSVFL